MIDHEVCGDVVVLAPADSLDGRRARELRELVARDVEAGRTQFVVDMSTIEFIDSSGLGALVWSHSRASEAGGLVLLCGVGSRVRSLIALTRLDEVLQIRSTRDAALAELATSPTDREP